MVYLLRSAMITVTGFSKNLATRKNHLSGFHDKWFIFKLTCQGSNLDFSDPESDVLPVTPQVSIGEANLRKFLILKQK